MSKEAAKRPSISQHEAKASIACRAQAVANANRNMAAMAAEKRAIDETQTPALDAMECEVNGLHRQLYEVKESLRKRCLNILNSLVGRKWTIDTSDTLAKRMLRPSKWTAKSQVQMEAEAGQKESQDWFGPSANDVFGDCLVIAERNPYRIVGVFARRYQDTRQRLPYQDDIVCSTIFPCIQHLEPQARRQLVLKAPIEIPRPIKAFPDSGATLPANQDRPAGGNYIQSSALESYPKATVENNNMRIPTRLAEYLERNCVTVERPSWDRRCRQKNEQHHSGYRRSRSSAQADDTESVWEDDEDNEQRAFGLNLCDVPSILPESIASGLPQFVRREIGNRWLPTLFAEADVRISEYWKLENMKNREKAAWVYQGIQTEPKPYPWEEVPLEGKPLSRKEIMQQRKAARSRRHLSLEAERLLRGIGQGGGSDGDASESQRRVLPNHLKTFSLAIIAIW
ncbi:hypothetical protein, conserved [Eimeria praecox]|uniref:Uncharacterized protein n=1 Tax=Eimeria praecox TaxID=51316 RepID=U6G3S4_9EIME|nr:hypothetical protein, conserved [Eimeria praecox]